MLKSKAGGRNPDRGAGEKGSLIWLRTFLGHIDQKCSWDRDFIKNSWTWKFVDYAKIFLKIFKKKHHHFEVEILSNFWHFSYLQTQQKTTTLNYINFPQPYLCSIPSLKATGLLPRPVPDSGSAGPVAFQERWDPS